MTRPPFACLLIAGLLLASASAGASAAAALEDQATSPLPTCRPDSKDADGDGLCDRLERAIGTDPHDEDTDGDGVPDGVEDANQDGRIGPGESDPRVPGLFPGSAPHIPEPLLFDLVRGLGASQGELEANTLFLALFDRRGRPTLEWAPEIEWAVLDGVAVELEVPMEGGELVALKGAAQVTLPGGDRRFAHGIQGIGEYFVGDASTQATLLYLIGARSSSWSTFSMIGARRFVGASSQKPEFLFNPSVFYDLAETLTVGVETNIAAELGRRETRIIPQMHYQISRHVRIQLGAGVQIADEHRGPLVTTRIILE